MIFYLSNFLTVHAARNAFSKHTAGKWDFYTTIDALFE
jgi:hypothetical protein